MKKLIGIFSVLFIFLFAIPCIAFEVGGGGLTPGACTTVGSTGCDYTDLSDALAAASAKDTILLYPGTYTDTLTFTKNSVSIKSKGSGENVIIIQANANIIDFGATTGCSIEGCQIYLSAPTTAIAAITGSTGTFSVQNCKLNLTCTENLVQADQPRIAELTGAGKITISHGKTIYNHSGTCGGTAVKAPYKVATGGLIKVQSACNIDIDGSGSALATAVGITSGTGVIKCVKCDIDVDDDTATYTVGTGYLSSGTSIGNEFGYNVVHVHGGDNNAYGLLTVNSTVKSFHNHIHVECSGSGNAYSLVEIGSGEINSCDDNIIATGGKSGNVKMTSSETAGDYTVTGTNHYSAFSTLTDDSATPNVSASDRWLCSNSNPTTITSFPGGIAGDQKFIKFTNGNTTVDFSGTTLKGNHGVDVTFNSGEYLNMTFDGTNWDCTIYHNALPVTSFSDTVTIHDDGDSTKKLAFQCSGITAGNTRTITPPDANTT
ncbi:MAG: hypothetical protein ACTSO3_16880, partial [Candidatus Heimdallarchaeaceae archaeon]